MLLEHFPTMLPMPNPPQSHVLLVDDSTAELRWLMELMADSRFRLTVAMDGKDGYHKAALQQPDLILMDVRMPVMDGLAACRLLKADARTQQIPVIFLSAANDVAQRIEGLRVGAVDYIGKPFDEIEVMSRVQVHLDLVRQLRATTQAQVVATTPTGPSANAALLRAAQKYLREHISHPPSPQTLAHLLGTNEKRLTKTFVDELGMPVYAWLREERLLQAKTLLMTTDTPLAYLAQHLGFANPGNFARAFKERFACTASSLRKGRQVPPEQDFAI